MEVFASDDVLGNDSYRQELNGLHLLLIALLGIKQVHSDLPTITIRADNSAAIDAINHNDCSDTLDINHAFKSAHDILKEIFTKRKHLPSLTCDWIRGHPERRKPETEWSVHEKMQVRADTLTSFAYTSTMCTPQNPPTSSFFADTIRFKLDGKRLSFPAATPLVREISSRLAKISIMKRFSFPSTAFNIIDITTLKLLKPPSAFADCHQQFKARYGYWMTEKRLHN